MTAERHPVADLLRPEDKERVRVATFRRDKNARRQTPRAVINGNPCCPLAVAFGLRGFPYSGSICRAMGWPEDGEQEQALADFINTIDQFQAADVKVMLGCDS